MPDDLTDEQRAALLVLQIEDRLLVLPGDATRWAVGKIYGTRLHRKVIAITPHGQRGQVTLWVEKLFP